MANFILVSLKLNTSLGLLPLLLFTYESSCKVPYPDLACFGKFNKPLWWKQGIAQRPLEFIWYLLLIPQGPSSDTHVDSLRTCRNFSTVLCVKKKKKRWWSFVWELVAPSFFSSFLEILFLEWSFSSRQSKSISWSLQLTVISYLGNKNISYSSVLSIKV